MDKLGMQVEINFEAYDKVNNKLDNLLKKLQKANKLDIEVDTRTFEKLEKQFNQLKDKINKSFQLDISTENASGSINAIDNIAKTLEKKQIKLINSNEVQVIEQVKKNLLETEKVIRNLESKTITKITTFDYAKTQADLYKQLNNLQKDEFSLKERLIGQDGQIKTQLEQQLQLVRQQQGEVGKLIASYQLQGSDNINKYLSERSKLVSELTIAQEKYNKKVNDTENDIENRVKQYQNKMGVEIQNLQTKYKDLVPKRQLEEFQMSLNRLNATDLKGLQNQFKELDNQFKKLQADTKANGINIANQDARGLSSLLTKDIVAFASWKLIGDAIMTVYRGIGDSVRFIYDMDTAMVSLKKITSETSEVYKQFEVQANKTAITLARGTTEVVDATVAWKKAGYTLDEAKKLSATTLIGANVGDVDVKSIQEYLVAPLKAWNIEAQNSIKILDIMNNVSNQHAVTIQDLGQSYARASSVMAMANNTIEETTALVTSAQAQTQLGGDTIGNGMRTIALRLTQMKDEEGNIIPKLAEDFEKVGVHLKDTNGNLLSTYEIIKQLNKVWESGTLSQDEKLNLLEKGAGKQRSNILAAMIENFGEAEKTLQDSLHSTNSAMKEQEAYMNSLQAKTKVFGESINGIYLKIVSSDGLKSIVDSGTDFANVVGKIIDKIGALNTIVTTASGVMFLFNSKFRDFAKDNVPFMSAITGMTKEWKAYILTQREATIAQIESGNSSYGLIAKLGLLRGAEIATTITTIALQTALTMGLSLVITGVISGISKLYNTFINAEKAVASQKQKVQELTDSYNNLKTQIDELRAIQSPNEEQKQYLSLLERELNLKQNIIDVEKRKLLDKDVFGKGVWGTGIAGEVNKNVTNVNDIFSSMDAVKNEIDKNQGISTQYWIDQINESKDSLKEYELKLIENKKALQEYSKVAQGEAKKGIDSLIASIDTVLPKLQQENNLTSNNTDTIKKNTDAKNDNAKANDKNSTKSMVDVEKEFAKALNDSKDSIKEVNQLLDQHKQSGEWNYDTILKLAQEYPDLLDKLGDEAELEKRLIQIKQGKVDAVTNSVKAQMNAEASLINNLAKGYAIDVANLQGTEEEKLRIVAEAIKKRASLYLKESQAMEQSMQPLMEKYNNGTATQEEIAMLTSMGRSAMGMGTAYGNAVAAASQIDTHLGNYLKLQTMMGSLGNFTGSIGSSSYDGKGTMEDATKKAEELRNEMLNNVKEVESEITSLIKAEFDKRKALIEQEYQNKKEALQKEKNLYNEQNQEDDYQKNLSKEQQVLNGLNDKITNARRDTSLSGQARLRELLLQQQEQQQKIDDLILSHTRDTNNKLFDEKLEQLDKEKEAQQKSLEELYSEQNISKMVNSAMLTGQLKDVNGNLISVLDAYVNFQNTFNNGMTASGKVMESEFISKWQQIQDLIKGTSGVDIGISFKTLPVASYDVGSTYITKDQYALIHKGESVLPAKYNIFTASGLNNFMSKVKTPNIAKGNVSGSINFNEPFMVIQGNVTKDMLPELDTLVDKAKDKVTRAIMQNLNNMGVYEH